MTVGRKKSAIPRIPWKVPIRADLAAEVELLIADPMREKAKYGARTKLIEQLLERYLDSVRRGEGRSDVDRTDINRLITAIRFELDHWSPDGPARIRSIIQLQEERQK